MNASAETRWLIGCLRALARGEPLPVGDPTLDWTGVLATMEAESLGPALALAGKNAGPDEIPRLVRERARYDGLAATARHLCLGAELGRLLGSFAAARLPVMPLKGPALAELLYPDPTIRPCCDLDLLIRPDDLTRADALLRELGYRRLADAHSFQFDAAFDHATLYEEPSGVRVDLHWSLLSEPRYAWNEREGQEVWERAVPTSVAGQPARILCCEDLLLYLSTHLAVHHAVAGVLWHYDLFLLVTRSRDALDWDRLSARARQWRVQRAVYFALTAADSLFRAGVPSRFLAELAPRGARAAAVRWIVRHRTPAQRRSMEHLIGLLLVDRGRDVVRAMTDSALPSPAWIAARYDGAGPSRLRQYLAHYRRLATVVGQASAGLGRHAR